MEGTVWLEGEKITLYQQFEVVCFLAHNHIINALVFLKETETNRVLILRV